MCCNKKNGSSKDTCCPCACHPYADSYLMTGQIISIVAFVLSWLWWVTLVLGAPTLIVLQVAWCCKMKRGGFVAATILAALTTLGCLFSALWMIFAWKGLRYCHVFTLTDTYYYYYGYYDDHADYCNEQAWAVIGFIEFILWAIVTYCIAYFIKSGRYDRCAASADADKDQDDDQEIELGSSPETLTAISPTSSVLAATPVAAYVPEEKN